MAEPHEITIATALRLGQALGLARGGRLREAQRLLAADGTLPESGLELHALAALATGEGDYSRALRLWRLLLQREPGHAEAKRMIDSIELWLSRPDWFRYIPVALIAGGAGLVVALLMLALSPSAPEPVPAPAAPPYLAPAAAPRPAAYTPAAPPPTVSFPAAPPSSDTRRKKTR